MAAILAPIGGYIVANPITTAVVITAVNVVPGAVDFVFPGFTEGVLGRAGSLIGGGITFFARPVIKGTGEAVGGGVIDAVESLATGALNRMDERLNAAGQSFERNKLAPIFGEKNVRSSPGEYVDITQMAFYRVSDFVSDHSCAISSLAGGALAIGGGYLAKKAYELHQNEKASPREKAKFTIGAGASLLTGAYLVGRAILGS